MRCQVQGEMVSGLRYSAQLLQAHSAKAPFSARHLFFALTGKGDLLPGSAAPSGVPPFPDNHRHRAACPGSAPFGPSPSQHPQALKNLLAEIGHQVRGVLGQTLLPVRMPLRVQALSFTVFLDDEVPDFKPH